MTKRVYIVSVHMYVPEIEEHITKTLYAFDTEQEALDTMFSDVGTKWKREFTEGVMVSVLDETDTTDVFAWVRANKVILSLSVQPVNKYSGGVT